MVRSAIFAEAADARDFALRIAVEAYGGELRIVRIVAGRVTASAYATAYEIECWRPGHQIMPASADSAWESGERRRDQALAIYNRMRRALTEAAGADLIRRTWGREVRLLLRSVLIDGTDQFGDRARIEELKRKT